MKSIVDGLRPEFEDQITILYMDADTPSGQQMMAKYNLRSHPSTIVTDAEGELLWSWLGGLNEEQIRTQLEEFANSVES